MEADHYGNQYSDLYDLVHGDIAPDELVTTLADLAGDGPVLELGVGTGRVAVPLANRGLEVHGIDSSAAILEKLTAKPGGDAIRAKVSALPDIGVDGQFSLVVCVANTLLLLPTQDDQLQTIRNAADLLTADGVLVLETPATPPPSATGVMLAEAGENATVLWAFFADMLSQQFHNREIILGDNLATVLPFDGRMVLPAELDLMAQLAGLQLRARWSGWDQAPAGPDSMAVVSVYEQRPT